MRFYLKKTKLANKCEQEFQERKDSCEPKAMFDNLLKNIESSNTENMPVRKFFNNTFKTLLNDACFLLKKRQEKAKGKEATQLYTTQGMIKFVSNHLQDNLPDVDDEEPDEAESSEGEAEPTETKEEESKDKTTDEKDESKPADESKEATPTPEDKSVSQATPAEEAK